MKPKSGITCSARNPSVLRPPPAARSRAPLYATGDPRSPRHGLESPCHVARAFQPVGLGRAVRSAVRSPSSALRRPSSVRRPPFPPVKNPSVCSVFSVGQPSAPRRRQSLLPRGASTADMRVCPLLPSPPPASGGLPPRCNLRLGRRARRGRHGRLHSWKYYSPASRAIC